MYVPKKCYDEMFDLYDEAKMLDSDSLKLAVLEGLGILIEEELKRSIAFLGHVKGMILDARDEGKEGVAKYLQDFVNGAEERLQEVYELRRRGNDLSKKNK